MPEKLRKKSDRMRSGKRKINLKMVHKKASKIQVRHLVVILVLGLTMTPKIQVRAESCPDIRIVFARGSGGEIWHDQNYLEFKNTVEILR